MEIKVVGIWDSSVDIVSDTGSSHAYPFNIVNGNACQLTCLNGHLSHIIADILCGTGTESFCGSLCDYLKLLIYNSGLDICSAQVNANVIFHLFDRLSYIKTQIRYSAAIRLFLSE